MKQVKALKDKHRPDIWGDADGYVWFYDVGEEAWFVLSLCVGGVECIANHPTRGYGPYTCVRGGFR